MSLHKHTAFWSPDGYLARPLILTAHADLSIFNGTVDAPAGAPYRIAADYGSVVQVEVLSDNGEIATGYTVSNRLGHHRQHWWNLRKRH
jgi:hypothetical protein